MRYEEETLKHCLALHVDARALNRKKAVFGVSLACGHFFAYTEGPGRGLGFRV